MASKNSVVVRGFIAKTVASSSIPRALSVGGPPIISWPVKRKIKKTSEPRPRLYTAMARKMAR